MLKIKCVSIFLITLFVIKSVKADIILKAGNRNFSNVSSVDIEWLPDNVSYATRIDEAGLEEKGCRYATDNQSAIDEVVALTNSSVSDKELSSVTRKDFETRNKIIFHYHDGQKESIVFSQRFSNLSYSLRNLKTNIYWLPGICRSICWRLLKNTVLSK